MAGEQVPWSRAARLSARGPDQLTAPRAWLILGFFAGLRAHEIGKLRADDVNRDYVFVVGKGGSSDQVPTHPLVWAEAQNRPRTGWWFPGRAAGGHVTTRTVSAAASAHFSSHGIEGSIHRCRHTYATALLRAGVNVRVTQSLMRHRSLASTMLYCAVDEEERLDGISRLGTTVPVRTVPDVSPIWDIPSALRRVVVEHDPGHGL